MTHRAPSSGIARLAIVNELLDDLLGYVQAVDPVLRTLLAGLFIFLETSVLIGLVVPGDTVVLVASTAVDSPLGYFSLVAIAIVGALGGASVGFAIGRFFGPRLRGSRLGNRIGEKNWQRAENFLDHRGGIAVFISRFLPVLHSLTPLVVGMSTLRYRTFMLWLAPACVIWSFAYVSVGSAAAEGYRSISDQLSFAAYFFVGAILGFWLLVYAVKRLLDRYVARFADRRGDGDATTPED
jgi:membrane protein DedA with SNARE-associated domain